MVQPFFVFSDIVFFLLRLAVAFFFLRDARKLILQKEKRKTIFEVVLLVWEIIAGVLLAVGTFTQIVALILVLFLIVQKSRKARCLLLETNIIILFVVLSLFVLITVGGGIWSVDNMLQIVIY